MDLQTIANGIATAVGTVTATNGSESESATAAVDFPDSVGKLALLVYPPETATLSVLMGQVLDDYEFHLRLLRDPVSMAGRTAWIYAWATALRPLLWKKFTLGVAGVTNAEAVGMETGIAAGRYSNLEGVFDRFDLVDITVRVQVFEIASGVAP